MAGSPFFNVIGFTFEPDAHITRTKGGLVVLPSGEGRWDLKFSDINRIGVLDLFYALKPLL